MSDNYAVGWSYLRTYAGVLKLFELGISSLLIIFIAIIGYDLKSNLLNGIAIYALISAFSLTSLHIWDVTRKSSWPWFWLECVNCVMVFVIALVAATLVTAVLTKGCIVTGAVGYILCLVYFLDGADKYKQATTPRATYVWTTPNMPELYS